MKIICASESPLSIEVLVPRNRPAQKNHVHTITIEQHLVVLLDNKRYYYGFMSDLFADHKYQDIQLKQYYHNKLEIQLIYYGKDTRIFNRYYFDSSRTIMCYGYLTESSLEKARKWFLKTSLVES